MSSSFGHCLLHRSFDAANNALAQATASYPARIAFPPLDANQHCLPVGWGKGRRTPLPAEAESCLTASNASPFMGLVSKVVVGPPRGGRCWPASGCPINDLLPCDEEERKHGNDWPPFGCTMVGTVRLQNFRAAVEEVERNHVAGAIVELGVWRGGGELVDSSRTFAADCDAVLLTLVFCHN